MIAVAHDDDFEMTQPGAARKALRESREAKTSTNNVVAEAAAVLAESRAYHRENHVAIKLRAIIRGAA